MRQALFAVCAFGTLICAANAAEAGWVKGPEKSFSAQSVKIDGMVGTLDVQVAPGPAKVRVSGAGDRVAHVHITADGGQLTITDDEHFSGRSGWKWVISLFSDKKHSKVKTLQVHVVMPEKAPLDVADFIGDATVGSTHGPVDFEAAGSGKVKIGNIASANLHLAGSGHMTVGTISGPLSIEVAGSGKLKTGDAQSLHSEIAGSGVVTVGNIRDGLHSEIAGSGDLSATSVHGGVHLEIAGSGDVKIAGGEADPFHVEVMGSGDVHFNGIAHNPNVEAMGSGKVWVKAVKGPVDSDAGKHLIIGSQGDSRN